MISHRPTSLARATRQDRAAKRLGRRDFLRRTIGAASLGGLALRSRSSRAASKAAVIEAGEGSVDTTPPLGLELAGFHRPPGKERLITGIRQPTAARGLVLKHGDVQAAIVSLDILAVSRDFANRVQRRVSKRVGIPAGNVRIAATHTHSMPTFCYLRQWGAIPEAYMRQLEEKIVRAVEKAKADLAPAQMYLGLERVVGGNFNRTSSTWKTDAEFDNDSTDADRWLDTMLHALLFQRAGGRRNLLWYHFSAHPVCYRDGDAGPDWPGLVEQPTRDQNKLTPSFLQGHCGDVNPGSGKPWLGQPEKVADAIHRGLQQALDQAQPVRIDAMRVGNAQVDLPLDIALLEGQLERYRKDPSQCTRGEWVDAEFAADWAQAAAKWDPAHRTLAVPISALQLGEVGILFHPAELYSYYGLAIRRDSPTKHTLAVGYTDDMIGYLPDPAAYEAGEYAAVTVPKILDLPPFTPQAAGRLATAAVSLLRELAG